MKRFSGTFESGEECYSIGHLLITTILYEKVLKPKLRVEYED